MDITFRDATDDGCVSSAVTSPWRLHVVITGSIVPRLVTLNPADDTYDIVVTATVLSGSGAYDVLVDGVEATANVASGTSTTITAGGATVDITLP